MKLHQLLVLPLLLTHALSHAELSQKSVDIMAIADQVGIINWFHERNEARIARANKLADRVKDSIAQYAKSLAPHKQKAFNQAIQRFQTSVLRAYSPDEQLQIWVRVFGSNITDNEAHQMRAFYESPLGKALIRSSAEASSAISEFNDQAADRLIEIHYKELIAEVEGIVAAGK